AGSAWVPAARGGNLHKWVSDTFFGKKVSDTNFRHQFSGRNEERRLRLTDRERAMLDGAEGKARQKAMELLVRYGEALGAERFVDTTNVAGVPGQPTPFLAEYYKNYPGGLDAIFSHFDLDSDELVEMPKVATRACHLQGGYDPDHWQILGASPEAARRGREGERYAADHGIEILKTCTPYLVGNVPKRGEHCAWMESSAVIYCNAVLGARTNTE